MAALPIVNAMTTTPEAQSPAVETAPIDAAMAARRRGLAAYAATAIASRGRLHGERHDPTRTPWQRDRDRIIHCTAFRRLTYKTQVFVYHEGDHYRTRLTHTLEVAQIARSIARILALDEDLAEAIALAHDLGHPPFGHAGEQALDQAMREFGGFDHNAQSLRIVTALERRYAAFEGLNLTWETLEGLVKHNGPLLDAEGRPLGPYAKRGLPATMRSYVALQDLRLDTYPSAEAQVAAIADDIAYNNHDIDDGFRAGLYTLNDLAHVPPAARLMHEVRAAYPGIEAPQLIHEINRRLISRMIEDVVAETRRRLAELRADGPDRIREAGVPVVAFSPAMQEDCDELRFFLLSWVYRHRRVTAVMSAAQTVLTDLFARYMSDPAALPERWLSETDRSDRAALARQVCDFIAGMTDRFALREHRRLFDATPELR